ncbi:MAG: DUF1932 domain-containing protein [Caulobacteraceae bacterium]
MKVFTRVALIGFGEVGQTLAADLKRINFPEITAYDPLFEVKESGPAKALTARTVMAAPDAIAAVSNAELVISCVTAAQDIEAAKSVAPGLPSGAYYLDVNSVSPAMKQACARVINEAGGNYVEAAVMSPIAGKRIASPMLLGGAFAEDFLERAKPIGFTGATVYSPSIGQASATKMCRSVIIKGVEALLTESLITARKNGVEEAVLESLDDLLPVGDWPALARYMISRSLEHGTRRAEELREAAGTVAEAGLEPLMSRAIAARQDWAAAHKDALKEKDLGDMLDVLVAALETPKP